MGAAPKNNSLKKALKPLKLWNHGCSAHKEGKVHEACDWCTGFVFYQMEEELKTIVNIWCKHHNEYREVLYVVIVVFDFI